MRDILARLDATTPVVTEMLDDRNRVLAQVAHVDDVVVSGEIVSLLVTQLSEDQRLEARLRRAARRPTGSEIYLRPAELVRAAGPEVTFATVVAGAAGAARPPSATASAALGARCRRALGVRVNPAKSETFTVAAGRPGRGARRGVTTAGRAARLPG